MSGSEYEPILPLEIFGKIIEMVGECIPSDGAVSIILASIKENERVETLRACALVCKAFAHFTRPFFFHYADVGFNDGSSSERRLVSLLDMVDSKPDLARFIRDLRFDFDSTSPGPLMSHRNPEDLTRYTDFLLHITSLESISLSYSYSTYHLDDYLSTPEVTELCERVIETYAAGSKPRLRSLHAKKIRRLPFPTIYGCATLHTLSLDRCLWPDLTAPVPQLRTLKLRKIRDLIPFTNFLYLPSLESLSMEYAEFESIETYLLNSGQRSYQPQLQPSFGLDTLSLNTYTDEYKNLVTYLQLHAQVHGREPLSRLTSLSLRIDQYRRLMPNFRALSSLRFLNIQVGTLWEKELLLSELNLDEDFGSGGALTNLRSLSLYATTHFEHRQYVKLIGSLPLLFTSIAPENELRELNVRMDTPGFVEYTPPSIEGYRFIELFQTGSNSSEAMPTLFWTNLPIFIRNCTNFPNLRTLTLELTYYLRQGRRGQETEESEESTPQGQSNNSEVVINVNVVKRKMEDNTIIERLIELHKEIEVVKGDRGPHPADSILSDCKMRVDAITTYTRCVTLVFQKPD
ncbi:hypothetical protein BJ165DRAFT_1530060 [Panaeolus papilionaceus]|nr:hypothetical protein BJ165DRAFT_1530060 [Panaeolus papilionaceus]